MGEREFIMQAIANVRPMVEQIGFEQLKVKDVVGSLGVSKSKFFNYFGSLYGIMELLLHHELTVLYTGLDEKTKDIHDAEDRLPTALQYRLDYIEGNTVLRQFYTTRSKLTHRFDALNSSVCETESGFLQRYIGRSAFSEKEVILLKEKLVHDAPEYTSVT